jgi:membrane-bound metal-dependent hydrolase YbcI (DUF457 family)
LALSYLIAQFGVQQQYGPKGTALVLIAGCLPDADGFSLLFGWRTYRRYHRVLGHGLPMTLLGPAALTALGSGVLNLGPFGPLWCWLQVAFAAHLFTDILFYGWPAQLLWPLSSRAWALGLVRWNDLVPTLCLYTASLVALCSRSLAPVAALVGLGALAAYLLWRFLRPRPLYRWGEWLAGGWAEESAPVWRWLTGDFIP